jgi:shikimate dehydrogenase
MPTLKLALIGKNLSHSISPELHQLLFPLLRGESEFDDISYDLVECAGLDELNDWMRSAYTNGYRGANVTIPFKSEAFLLAQHTLGAAKAISSANTFLIEKKITAVSTDGDGFITSLLREHPDFHMKERDLVVLGAGGAARAVLNALLFIYDPRSITISSRNQQSARDLATFIEGEFGGVRANIATIDQILFREYLDDVLVVNATPIGQFGSPGNILTGFEWTENDFAIDLVYNPNETEFLQNAKIEGATTLGGLGMLIEQAALAETYWLTGELTESSPLSTEQYFALKEHLVKLLV